MYRAGMVRLVPVVIDDICFVLFFFFQFSTQLALVVCVKLYSLSLVDSILWLGGVFLPLKMQLSDEQNQRSGIYFAGRLSMNQDIILACYKVVKTKDSKETFKCYTHFKYVYLKCIHKKSM